MCYSRGRRNPSEESGFLCDRQSHGCVVERIVFSSPRLGRMSVIQYWNRETTAVVSSETQKRQSQTFQLLLTAQYHRNTGARDFLAVAFKE